MDTQRKILRELAHAYYALANDERNAQTLALHKASNDLRPVRPVVMIHELPWNEMNVDGSLTLACEDPDLRSVEWFFRSNLLKSRYFRADSVFAGYVPVGKVTHTTSMGLSVKEDTLATDSGNPIVAHRYEDILKMEEDLDRITMPKITYDEEETMRRYQKIGDWIGDIIPIKICGSGYFGVATWDDISRYRGVENLLTDLALRPDFMHKTVRILTDVKKSLLTQMEELGLFDNDPYDLHCTPIRTSDLPSPSYKGGRITRKDIWGRGAAQIFDSVSKSMHDEFDIAYMQETIGTCGLSYYGCCEPLDKRIDVVSKLSNLRKISITPWADVMVAAEAINSRYVLSAKPNPASVAVSRIDLAHVKKELSHIVQAADRFGCACDITLKDISTCKSRPQNIFEWEKMAMSIVKST